ncbi:MAG: DNA/RNA nuclease SfsA [Puniceicoccales bacterium]|nr:DNA/RNA nuclease SfsA [Puniceicoccales bacterium]
MAICLNLVRGELLERPNRFVFVANVNGETLRLHCPVTGSIGGLKDFRSIPCLLSPSVDNGRSTAGTVEAISLDGGNSWIGINQNRINGWMEKLLMENALAEMVSCKGAEIIHEVRVGDSRIDLCVVEGDRRTYIEIKTPMRDLLIGKNIKFQKPSSKDYFARGIKHFGELAKLATAGNRTIVAMCCMYDAREFSPPKSKWSKTIEDAVAHAAACGVESWQINLQLSPSSIAVAAVRKLPLFSKRH